MLFSEDSLNNKVINVNRRRKELQIKLQNVRISCYLLTYFPSGHLRRLL